MLKYHDHYGYPYRWAILAELAWRLEHLPLLPWTEEREENPGRLYRVADGIRGWAYPARKRCEHRGVAARKGAT